MNDIDLQIAGLEAQLITLCAEVDAAFERSVAANEDLLKAQSACNTVWHRLQVMKYQAERQRKLTLATATPSPAAACPPPGATPQPTASSLPAVHGTAPGADFSPTMINRQSDPLNP